MRSRLRRSQEIETVGEGEETAEEGEEVVGKKKLPEKKKKLSKKKNKKKLPEKEEEIARKKRSCQEKDGNGGEREREINYKLVIILEIVIS